MTICIHSGRSPQRAYPSPSMVLLHKYRVKFDSDLSETAKNRSTNKS